MANETPIVKLNYFQCTGPTANCVWSLDNKKFFSIEQLIEQMKETDTLKGYVPDLFSQVQHAANVSCCALCNGLRPIMNTRGVFTLEGQEMLAPQLMENNESANTRASHEREGFFEQLQRHVAENPHERSDEDQS